MSATRLLERSGLFDPVWYAGRYVDVDMSSARSALDHYLRIGVVEDRWPHPLFDPVFYRTAHMAGNNHGSPLHHYVTRGMAADLDPHPLIEAAWYRQTYLAGEEQPSPAVHYSLVGSRAGFRPNRAFDPAFYRAAYPDVAVAGLEPLVHFATFGEAEGRWPAADLDLSTRDPTSPTARLRPRAGTLARRLREREPCRREPIALVADLDPQALETRAREGLDLRLPTTMILTHRWGGGVSRAIDDAIRAMAGRSNVALVVGHDPYLHLTIFSDPGAAVRLTADSRRDMPRVGALLRSLRIDRTLVHHVLDVPCVRSLIEAAHAPHDLFLHDYHLISPQPHLVDCDGRFVGEDLQRSGPRLIQASARPDLSSLREWQRRHRWLHEGASRIVAPSRDLAQRFRRRYPEIAIEVRPLDDVAATPLQPTVRRAGEPLRVALLGDLARHKGYGIVADAARLAAAQGEAITFVLIGSSFDDGALRSLGIEVTGAYRDPDLPGLIERNGPDLLWLPSQCPETYSFTLSAALRTGKPILASDIGAFPERLADLAHSSTVRWDAPPSEWIAAMKTLAERTTVRADD